MITVNDLSLNFSGRLLYDDVNLKFTPVIVTALLVLTAPASRLFSTCWKDKSSRQRVRLRSVPTNDYLVCNRTTLLLKNFRSWKL